MVTIRSAEEIILDLVELLKILRPSADSKPGSVLRDVLIELPASAISQVYDELSGVSNLQSLRIVGGSDLDNLLSNYGLTRKIASKSSGLVLYTFSSIPAAVAINKGDLVFASNGTSFAVANGLSVNPANSNLYRSLATKYRNDLDFLNISDIYAIEVTVQATTPGTSGNLSKYSINKTSTPNVSNVTNVFSFSGGGDQEDDASFRNRGLSIFSGSSTGTALGYKNTVLSDSAVLDAIVIEPGNPLMTRDGTVTIQNDDGSLSIVSEGSGGKVDIIVLGNRLTEFTDSYIYQDKSNQNDPTSPKNIFTLGQITGDANKTISRRRIDDIAAGVLPAQPVNDILEVTGSLSGSNFVVKEIDEFGRVSGNFELLKDTGAFAGSPFGFDKFAWVSDRISLFEEDRIKSKFNGQDNVTFTDVIQIPEIQQNISITNENSLVSAGDKSIIQLLHTPASNISRVFNVNTGERYIVTDQNVDGDDAVNSTGRVQITGNTLPNTSDVLQVDYTWIVDFDPFVDYDGKIIKSNPRPSNDSIDWDLSNAVRNEVVSFVQNTDGAFYTGFVKHPVSVILSASKFSQADGVVQVVTIGNFAGRLSVVLAALNSEVVSVDNIVLQNATLEVYNTIDADGVFTNDRVVIGSEIKFNCTVILPTDTPAQVGDTLTAYFNQTDTFTIGTSVGNFTANQITIPTVNLSITSASTLLRINYLSNIQDALTAAATNLPLSRSGNSFINNSSIGFTNSSVSNIIRKENQTIQLDGLNHLTVTLSVSSSDFILSVDKILTVLLLKNGKEIWNTDHPGTLGTDVNNAYVLTFSGFNSPAVGDQVAIFYTTDDIKRTQPFTFGNTLLKKNIQPLQLNANNQLFVDIQDLTTASVSFSIIDPTTNLVLASDTGTLTATNPTGSLGAATLVFGAVEEILLQKVQIKNSTFPNNNGLFDIIAVNTTTNKITITNQFSNINTNQISIVRLLDNKELWSDQGIIDVSGNTLTLPTSALANAGDTVVILTFIANNLRQAPSKLAITVADQINNSGIISVAGTTLTKIKEVIFTATNNSLKQNIAEALRSSLSVSSSATISSTISLSRITKLEKVTTTADNQVLSVDLSYDVIGTSINDNIFYANEMVDDDTLSKLDFILPGTTNNLANVPQIGDKFRITCYYATTSDSESLAFTRNGTLYTNKLFAFIDKVYISSGFTSTSVRFILSYFNQPATGSRYKAFYDYTAPKQNERIVIRFNYNQLISDATLDIEGARPINADVLVKAARALLVDVTMNVVIKPEFLTSSATVLQNLKDRLTTAINTNKLGDTLDASDLVTVAQSVDGIDRARTIYFNENGKTGSTLSLISQSNQFFESNVVLVAAESR